MSGKKIVVIAAWSIVFINFISFNSCTDDNLADLSKEDTTGIVTCDTTFTISYKYDVATIIKSNCPLCHTTAYYTFDGGGIKLDDWASVKVKADDGKLLCAINQTGLPDCQPMPRTTSSNSTPGPKIDNCYIMRIDAWIRQGAQNN